jgi:PKD repeat protein
VSGARTLTFAHTYFDEGTYNVRFTVRDIYGNSDTASERVRVDNDNDDDDDLSIEVISGPSTLEEDEEGTWRVRIETPDNRSYTVTADWDDDSGNDRVTVSGDRTLTFEHEYDDEGDYDIRFRISGHGGSDTETVGVEVEN